MQILDINNAKKMVLNMIYMKNAIVLIESNMNVSDTTVC